MNPADVADAVQLVLPLAVVMITIEGVSLVVEFFRRVAA